MTLSGVVARTYAMPRRDRARPTNRGALRSPALRSFTGSTPALSAQVAAMIACQPRFAGFAPRQACSRKVDLDGVMSGSAGMRARAAAGSYRLDDQDWL